MTQIILPQDACGLSQPYLAKILDSSASSLSRWERGKTLPGPEEPLKLAQAFGVTADYLLFKGAPRDGRVDIPDSTLLKLFEENSTMDEETRTVAKQLLDPLVFKIKVSEEVGKRA